MHTPKTLSAKLLKNYLPVRSPNAHKGDYGQVLIAGGHLGMGGAAFLAALGACTSGAGVTRVLTHPYYAQTLWYNLPEVMVYPYLVDTKINELLVQSTVCVVGPGLGADDFAHNMFADILKASCPLVIDAGALRLLDTLNHSRSNVVMTPHPGEAAALLNVHPSDIQQDRVGSLKALCNKYDCIVVLKGHETLIGFKDQISICKNGSPAMAVAGMGDLLAGLIGGFIAQGLPLFNAAELAVWVHAKAGETWAKDRGVRGLLTHELVPLIRKELNNL